MCEHGEKMLFDIPLTYKLLRLILRFDTFCLCKFAKNMAQFESECAFDDSLTFASIIALGLVNCPTDTSVNCRQLSFRFDQSSSR